MSQSGSLTGARLLLKRLRNMMARACDGAARLDRGRPHHRRRHGGRSLLGLCAARRRGAGTVRHRRPEGRKPSTMTRLRVGEGLVGDIASHARPLALADAQHHPQFAYRPETGEEIYQSLMGVPVLRSGRVLGVLVVQNKHAPPLHRGRGRDARRPSPWWWRSLSPAANWSASEELCAGRPASACCRERLDGVDAGAGPGHGRRGAAPAATSRSRSWSPKIR